MLLKATCNIIFFCQIRIQILNIVIKIREESIFTQSIVISKDVVKIMLCSVRMNFLQNKLYDSHTKGFH